MQQAQFGQQLRRLHIGAWILILYGFDPHWPLVAKSHKDKQKGLESRSARNMAHPVVDCDDRPIGIIMREFQVAQSAIS
jgi:hypothetical protein